LNLERIGYLATDKQIAECVGLLLACLRDQNRSGFFEGPAFFQPIRAFWKLLKLLWLAG